MQVVAGEGVNAEADQARLKVPRVGDKRLSIAKHLKPGAFKAPFLDPKGLGRNRLAKSFIVQHINTNRHIYNESDMGRAQRHALRVRELRRHRFRGHRV